MMGSKAVKHWRAATLAVLFALVSWVASAASPVESVAADDLDALKRSGTVLIDVRRDDEWRSTGVIDGSHLITAYDASGNLDPSFIDRVTQVAERDQPVALICRSGRRSAAAAQLLTESAGFTRVYNVDGGVQQWLHAGHPVEPCPSC
jgi:rhodanese-related sulfurtransferase